VPTGTGRVLSTSSLDVHGVTDGGHEIEHPMAVVILGGLVTSTLLNLFLLPAIYLRYGSQGATRV
jgi:Cu/Ag efflux pump CusA